MAFTITRSFLFALIPAFFTGILFQPASAQTLLHGYLVTPGNSNVLSESCTLTYDLVFVKDSSAEETVEIFVSNHGIAQFGVDYTFPPGAIPAVMGENVDTLVIPVTVVNDGLPEGPESLIWEFAWLTIGGGAGDFRIEAEIVDGYEIETGTASDTIQWCSKAPFTLTAMANGPVYWSPASAFDDSTGAEVIVRPSDSGWYYASLGEGDCIAKDSVYFDLAIARINSPDTLYVCTDGNGVILPGELLGLATQFTWIPSDSTLSNPDILTPRADPPVTTTYILLSDFGICTASDTVVVRVDSLPADLHIDVAPLKPYYCAGEIVALFSPSYDLLAYPDLAFGWITYDASFLTSNGLLNAALQLIDTTTYIRENINNACRSRDSILLYVVESGVPLSVTDTTLCPGESFRTVVLSDQVTDPQWEPEDGLSCSKCLDPVVTVTGTPGSVQHYQFSGKIKECPVGADLTITIPGLQLIGIAGDQTVCAGDQVPLTITNPEGLSDFEWNIISGSGSLSCTGCPSPVLSVTTNNSILVGVTASTSNEEFCGASGILVMNPGNIPQVSGPPVVACRGGTAIVTTGNPEYTNIVWSLFTGGANLELSCTTCETPTVTVNGPGNLSFTAEVDDPDICHVFGIVGVSLAVPDISGLVLDPDPVAGPIGQGTEVTVILNVAPVVPAPVTWTINGVTTTSASAMITFNASQEVNFIEASYINSSGCEQRDTISLVTVPPTYMIPNAFTPNSDDINDRFRIIINGNIQVEKFLIFNRWGQLVYEAPVGNMEGWDGRINNQPAPSDTYVYTSTLLLPDGKIAIVKGDVLLLR